MPQGGEPDGCQVGSDDDDDDDDINGDAYDDDDDYGDDDDDDDICKEAEIDALRKMGSLQE